MVIELDVMEELLVQHLADSTRRPVGLSDLPSKTPNMPYVILTPINSPRGYGTQADAECMREYVFQVTSTGKTPRQARWMGEQIRAVLIEKDGSGNRLLPEPMLIDERVGTSTPGEGATVLPGSIESDSLGAVIKSPEGEIFNIVDTYRMKVE